MHTNLDNLSEEPWFNSSRFCVQISGAHVLRLISRAGKDGSFDGVLYNLRLLANIGLSDAQ